MRGAFSWLLFDGVTDHVQRDRRAADPQRGHDDVHPHHDRRGSVDRDLLRGHVLGVAARERQAPGLDVGGQPTHGEQAEARLRDRTGGATDRQKEP
jgi:hypothetical protein